MNPIPVVWLHEIDSEPRYLYGGLWISSIGNDALVVNSAGQIEKVPLGRIRVEGPLLVEARRFVRDKLQPVNTSLPRYGTKRWEKLGRNTLMYAFHGLAE